MKGLKMKLIFSCACLLSFFMADLTSSSSSVGLLDVLDSFTQVMTGTDGKYNRSTSIKLIPDNTNVDLILITGRLSSTLLQPCGSLIHTCMSLKMLHGKDWSNITRLTVVKEISGGAPLHRKYLCKMAMQ